MTVTRIHPEITYRCHVCQDRGWVFLSDERNAPVKRCKGPMDMTCPYEEWAIGRAKELHPSTRGRKTREDL